MAENESGYDLNEFDLNKITRGLDKLFDTLRGLDGEISRGNAAVFGEMEAQAKRLSGVLRRNTSMESKRLQAMLRSINWSAIRTGKKTVKDLERESTRMFERIFKGNRASSLDMRRAMNKAFDARIVDKFFGKFSRGAKSAARLGDSVLPEKTVDNWWDKFDKRGKESRKSFFSSFKDGLAKIQEGIKVGLLTDIASNVRNGIEEAVPTRMEIETKFNISKADMKKMIDSYTANMKTWDKNDVFGYADILKMTKDALEAGDLSEAFINRYQKDFMVLGRTVGMTEEGMKGLYEVQQRWGDSATRSMADAMASLGQLPEGLRINRAAMARFSTLFDEKTLDSYQFAFKKFGGVTEDMIFQLRDVYAAAEYKGQGGMFDAFNEMLKKGPEALVKDSSLQNFFGAANMDAQQFANMMASKDLRGAFKFMETAARTINKSTGGDVLKLEAMGSAFEEYVPFVKAYSSANLQAGDDISSQIDKMRGLGKGKGVAEAYAGIQQGQLDKFKNKLSKNPIVMQITDYLDSLNLKPMELAGYASMLMHLAGGFKMLVPAVGGLALLPFRAINLGFRTLFGILSGGISVIGNLVGLLANIMTPVLGFISGVFVKVLNLFKWSTIRSIALALWDKFWCAWWEVGNKILPRVIQVTTQIIKILTPAMQTIWGFITRAAALFSGLSLIMQVGVGLMVGTFVAIGKAVSESWGGIVAWIGNIWDTVAVRIKAIWDIFSIGVNLVSTVIGGLFNWLSLQFNTWYDQTILPWTSLVMAQFQRVVEWIGKGIEWLGQNIGYVWAAVSSSFLEFVVRLKIVGAAIVEIINTYVVKPFTSMLDNLIGGFYMFLEAAMMVARKIPGIGGQIDSLSTQLAASRTAWEEGKKKNVLAPVNYEAQGMLDSVKNTKGGLFTTSLTPSQQSALTASQMSAGAKGSVAPKPGSFMASLQTLPSLVPTVKNYATTGVQNAKSLTTDFLEKSPINMENVRDFGAQAVTTAESYAKNLNLDKIMVGGKDFFHRVVGALQYGMKNVNVGTMQVSNLAALMASAMGTSPTAVGGVAIPGTPALPSTSGPGIGGWEKNVHAVRQLPGQCNVGAAANATNMFYDKGVYDYSSQGSLSRSGGATGPRLQSIIPKSASGVDLKWKEKYVGQNLPWDLIEKALPFAPVLIGGGRWSSKKDGSGWSPHGHWMTITSIRGNEVTFLDPAGGSLMTQPKSYFDNVAIGQAYKGAGKAVAWAEPVAGFDKVSAKSPMGAVNAAASAVNLGGGMQGMGGGGSIFGTPPIATGGGVGGMRLGPEMTSPVYGPPAFPGGGNLFTPTGMASDMPVRTGMGMASYPGDEAAQLVRTLVSSTGNSKEVVAAIGWLGNLLAAKLDNIKLTPEQISSAQIYDFGV